MKINTAFPLWLLFDSASFFTPNFWFETSQFFVCFSNRRLDQWMPKWFFDFFCDIISVHWQMRTFWMFLELLLANDHPLHSGFHSSPRDFNREFLRWLLGHRLTLMMTPTPLTTLTTPTTTTTTTKTPKRKTTKWQVETPFSPLTIPIGSSCDGFWGTDLPWGGQQRLWHWR